MGRTNDHTAATDDRRDWDPVLVRMYTEHFDELVRSARRLLDSRAIAEEAVQDAFVRYHTSPLRPAPGKELPYLRSIVLNGARSALRRRRTADTWRPDHPRTEPSTESEWLRTVDSTIVNEALAALPLRQREVLTIRHLVGCSERETADLLSISPGAVKTHASRGRATLRDLLETVAA